MIRSEVGESSLMDEEKASSLQTFQALNLKDRLAVLSGASLWELVKLPGLPVITVSDGPHGVRKPINHLALGESYPATCFPTASAVACSWNRDAARAIGEALAKECLHYNIQVLLGPGMNLKRHPAGGRSFEYWSEDPYLTSRMASAYVKGVQSSGKVGACVKHFCVNNQESHRFVVNAVVDERTMRELYLRHFEHVIQDANPATVMCAYNKVNGVYCSESVYLNKKILRDEWQFKGLVMTDWGATNNRCNGIKAGIDLEMPGSYGAHNGAIKKSLLSVEDDVDTCTLEEIETCGTRVLNLIHRYAHSYSDDSEAARENPVDWKAHYQLALEIARESIVLLRNENNVLPLSRGNSSLCIGVIGEFANQHPRYQGMGSSAVVSTKIVTVLEGMKKFSSNVIFADGYHTDVDDVESINEELLAEAIEVAQKSAVVLLCIGLPEIMESEGFDREHLKLPAQHNALVEACCKANTHVVVILSHGGVVELPWFDKVPAILEGYLLGEAGGEALVDVVFGVDSPSGKLAETFPIAMEDIAANMFFPGTQTTVEYREGLNVGYRYFDSAKKSVRYPFGHGLSYATFEYSDLMVVQQESSSEGSMTWDISFQLRNTGAMVAKEVAQCYVSDMEASVYRPFQELKEFSKIELKSGESHTINWSLTTEAFSFFDTGNEKWVVEKGLFEIRIGSSSQDIRLKETINVQIGLDRASQVAQDSYPPSQSKNLTCMDDESFRRRLGEWAPQADSELGVGDGLFHRNSLLKEVAKKTVIGWILLEVVYREACRDLADGPSKARQKVMVRKNVENLPLRVLVVFSRGNFTFALLDAIIAMMNRRVYAALTGFGVALKGMFFPR